MVGRSVGRSVWCFSAISKGVPVFFFFLAPSTLETRVDSLVTSTIEYACLNFPRLLTMVDRPINRQRALCPPLVCLCSARAAMHAQARGTRGWGPFPSSSPLTRIKALTSVEPMAIKTLIPSVYKTRSFFSLRDIMRLTQQQPS